MKFNLGDKVVLDRERILSNGYAYYGGYDALLSHFYIGNPPVKIVEFYPENKSYSVEGIFRDYSTFRVAEFEIKRIKNNIKKL